MIVKKVYIFKIIVILYNLTGELLLITQDVLLNTVIIINI